MDKVSFAITYPNKPWRGGRVEVAMPGHKFPLRIDVFPKTEMVRERDCKDVIACYTVNWSALGGIPVEEAELYVAGITLAITEAKKLTEQFKDTDYT
jgi:hypothetical protein